MKKLSLLTAIFLTACVTINIYFPAAAAEKAADEIIQDIQNLKPGTSVKPKTGSEQSSSLFYEGAEILLNFMISPAQAGDADLTIDSPQIQQLRAAMESRFSQLKPFYAAGFIGIKQDGFLAVKDQGGVPLKDRNTVNKLIAAENKDRTALYQAIADANGHPDWAPQIKATFAGRWVSNAQSGWWYQAGGNWQQK